MSRLDARAAANARSLAIVDAERERARHAPSATQLDEYSASFAQDVPDDRQTTRADGCSLALIPMSSITPEPIRWLWPGWLARGKFHILAGPPSTGKTTVALAKAATVTRGGTWPDGTRAPRGWVVMWSGEDDIKDTLTPRMKAAGADESRVHFVGTVNDETGERAFDPGHDVPRLDEAISRLPEPPVLLIVDPIVSAVTGDSHRNAETRRALAPLVDLAQKYNCAVIGITHFTKGTAGREPLERVTGSLAFGAVARVVMATVRRPDDHPDGPARLLVRAKSNIGPDGGGFHYSIEEVELDAYPGIEATRATLGEGIEGTARTLMASAETDPGNGERTATDEAADFLRDVLADGPAKVQDIQHEARGAGLSDKALRTARERLGIRPRKSGFSNGWVWELPREDAHETREDAQDAQQNDGASSRNEGIFEGDASVDPWGDV